MVEAHGAVGGAGGAKVLEIGAGPFVQLPAQPLVQTPHIGHLLQHLHTHGGAQELGIGQGAGPYLHDPVRPAAFVGEQAEFRHKARHGAHQLDDAGIPVAPGAQDAVGIYHRRGFRPGKNVPPLGHIAGLRQIAGAGKGVLPHEAQLGQLGFIAFLLAVHGLEYQVLQKGGRDVFIQGPGVSGKRLLAHSPCLQQGIVQLVHRLHHPNAKADDRMAVLAGDGHHPLRPKGFPI